MTSLRLALIPRDGFFFKDGRGWYASASGRGHAIPWPFPSTVLGAVRTAWGRAAEVARGQPFGKDDWKGALSVTMGPMLALRRRHGDVWSPNHRMWPVPADALYVDGERNVRRLNPTPRAVPTLGRDDTAAREALWRPDLPAGKPSIPPAFWTDTELAAWLSGRAVHAMARQERQERALPSRIDVRIQVDAKTGAAAEGALFAAETLETLQQTQHDGLFEWAIAVEAHFQGVARDLAAQLTLGSDRRLATWEHVDDSVYSPAAVAATQPAAGLRVLTLTPAHFKAGWLPDGFQESGGEYRGRLPGLDADLVLRAAFVERATQVSGWDMVGGRPKPTRRLVPAGSVYFFQKSNGAPITSAELTALWLAAVGQHQDEGFGRVIAAPWETR